MGFTHDEVDRVSRFWGFPQTAAQAGQNAVSMFEAITNGEIKALWVMGTNPAVSMPCTNDVHKALQKLDMLVVTEVEEQTDTSAYADVVLPALAWGEKDGTVTNSERCITRQRKFLEAPGDAKADWWIISQVACRMGYEKEFPYQSPAEVFREHAQLSAFENNGSRDFDIGGLANISNESYANLVPTYWPCGEHKVDTKPIDIFSAGEFFTADKKARFVSISSSGVNVAIDTEYPLRLNSGRSRDQWHTMTRTGRASRLNQHDPEPVISMHPLDGRRLKIASDQIVDVQSRNGSVRLRAKLTSKVAPGEAFVPMHWSKVQASNASINGLFAGKVDPYSGQPELKSEPVAVAPANITTHAILLDRFSYMDAGDSAYWVKTRFDQCHIQLLAFDDPAHGSSAWATALIGESEEILVTENKQQRCYAALEQQQLHRMIVISDQPLNRHTLRMAKYFSIDKFGPAERQQLIAGKPFTDNEPSNSGGLVCSCFGSARDDIEYAVTEQGLTTVSALGQSLNAGTNCGSCIPELKELIANHE